MNRWLPFAVFAGVAAVLLYLRWYMGEPEMVWLAGECAAALEILARIISPR
jgi:hypothetical protein